MLPRFNADAFICPLCGAYAKMDWSQLFKSGWGTDPTLLHLSTCARCKESAVWLEEPCKTGFPLPSGKMILPQVSATPMPHSDMPDSVRAEYEEARSVATASPRAAAALLRLAIQKLCIELGEKGENLNHDIGSLVEKGLPTEIQMALDALRVIGNNAVHPGELSKDDIAEVADSLFGQLNYIVEDRISRPKKLHDLYSRLPASAKQAIEKRDGK